MNVFQSVLDKTTLNFDENLDQVVSRELKSAKLTISVAEGVTGGALASRLTRLPGSSLFFQTGIVCYQSLSKIQFCGLSPSTIKKYGDINSIVAIEMANGLKQKTNSDIVVANTGLLGPANESYDQSNE